jgi:adenylate cyclase
MTVESAMIGGVRYSVSVAPIQNEFNLPWRLLIATPESDFIGPLQRARTFIVWLLIAIVPLQLLLIRGLSLRVSRGIVAMANNLHQIRLMNFDAPQKATRLFTQEITQLSDGITLLQSALRSFAHYIPVGVVKQLIAKGQPLELGVEKRKLAIMFTDLENFSTVSQSTSPDQLLAQLSAIFSAMTGAVSEELGTVDKFIGDSVMAFWGAPTDIDDSPLRACKAALRITRRIDKLNERWRQEGNPTLRVRVGINYASVLVGNIGTSERLSYTAIGDGVNVASRLEGTNKQFTTAICVSDLVHDEVATRVISRSLGEVSVKGREGQFPVYEILGIRDSDDPELVVAPTIA